MKGKERKGREREAQREEKKRKEGEERKTIQFLYFFSLIPTLSPPIPSNWWDLGTPGIHLFS